MTGFTRRPKQKQRVVVHNIYPPNSDSKILLKAKQRNKKKIWKIKLALTDSYPYFFPLLGGDGTIAVSDPLRILTSLTWRKKLICSVLPRHYVSEVGR